MAGLSLFYIAKLLSTTTVTGGVSITTSEDITDSWYSTQALATAAAVAAGVLFHANNGAVAVPYRMGERLDSEPGRRYLASVRRGRS